MSIQAKKEGLMRIIGMILILASLIPTLLLDAVIITCAISVLIMLTIIIPWFIFLVLVKLEKELLVENVYFFTVFLIFFSTGLTIINLFACQTSVMPGNFIFMVISNVFLLYSWHYALSIYKTKKRLFLISTITSVGITILIKINLLLTKVVLIIAIIPMLLVIIGTSLILIAEMRMKKRGLLNYI